MAEIDFPKEFRTGDVYSMIVFDLLGFARGAASIKRWLRCRTRS